jgi:type 1 glutamine amidotransferase
MFSEMSNDAELLADFGQSGLRVTFSSDLQFTAESLADFDMVFLLNATGEIFTEEEQATIEDYVNGGGALGGLYTAADVGRYWNWFRRMFEYYEWNHGPAGVEHALKVLRDNPATAHLPSPWVMEGMWPILSMTNEAYYAGYVTPLLVDENRMLVSWYDDKPQNRFFYTGLGGDVSHYDDSNVRRHILGGILWVTGKVE